MATKLEYKYLNSKYKMIIGCDEVGRGPLAGPVVCAATYLYIKNKNIKSDLDYLLDLGINDSKKITAKKRKEIISKIFDKKLILNKEMVLLENKNCKIATVITKVSEAYIEKLNIFHASLFGMKKSALKCPIKKNKTLVIYDGKFTPSKKIADTKEEALIKGDSKSLLVALSSILAKEYRDLFMEKKAQDYPGYGFETNAGYPTKSHLKAIKQLGITPIHRRSFKGVKEYFE